jgi:multiple sugar transport system substrate-binding protein
VPVIRETIKRSVPTLALPGAFAMHNMLDENLQAALVGEMSAKEAMANANKAWEKFIKKKGETKMVDAILQAKAGWPTLVDSA